jgi:hypothetical protein
VRLSNLRREAETPIAFKGRALIWSPSGHLPPCASGALASLCRGHHSEEAAAQAAELVAEALAGGGILGE